MASTIQKIYRAIVANWAREYDSQAPLNADACGADSAGATLLSVLASNKGAPTLYLMVFDSLIAPGQAGGPGNGSLPVFMPIALKQDTPLNLRLNDVPGGGSLFGHKFTNGIAFGISTTFATLTLDATSSVWVNLRYQN